MAYIGKSPSTKFSAAAKVDTFTGDGSTTTFDLANIIPAGGENSLQVFVNNVRQKPGASNAFTVGNDGSGDLKRITFTEAPAASDEIYVITTFEATNITEVGDGTIATAKIADTAVSTAKIADSAVTTAKIADGTIANADVSPSAAIADSKLATITTASKVNVSALSAPGSTSVFLRGDRSYAAIDTSGIDTNAFNISLLGFKMAVNEGLTVFNLVDGIVDEFHDESGTDEAEGSNDLYCATSDFYKNQAAPQTGSAGFSNTAVTEADTSTAATNPGHGAGTTGTFTVPSGFTSVDIHAWGAGGGGDRPGYPNVYGGGGGFATGTAAVTGGQALNIVVGEGGITRQSACNTHSVGAFGGDGPGDSGEPVGQRNGGGTGRGGAAGGGGLVGVFTGAVDQSNDCRALVIAGSGGGGGADGAAQGAEGGPGGGLTGSAGGQGTAQTSVAPHSGASQGGGGNQEQGGEGQHGAPGDGGKFYGAGVDDSDGAGGGAGWFGGGSGRGGPGHTAGGGGSSYYGHPQVTSGSTESGSFTEGGAGQIGPAGQSDPLWPTPINPGGNSVNVGIGADPDPSNNTENAGNGYVFLISNKCGATTSTTIVSNAFTSTSVPTTSRIVVFQENIDTPTLNTDVIASISRDGGSTFTTATLSDSGYVTGSSGQRILTGQATISGQPSGQSMRWKLALANNAVKIHGVSLQWS